VHFLKAVFVQ